MPPGQFASLVGSCLRSQLLSGGAWAPQLRGHLRLLTPARRRLRSARRRVRFAQGPLADKYRTDDGHPDREGQVARAKRSLGMSWGHDLTPSRCSSQAVRPCDPRFPSLALRCAHSLGGSTCFCMLPIVLPNQCPKAFCPRCCLQHHGAGTRARGGVSPLAGPPQAQVGATACKRCAGACPALALPAAALRCCMRMQCSYATVSAAKCAGHGIAARVLKLLSGVAR